MQGENVFFLLVEPVDKTVYSRELCILDVWFLCRHVNNPVALGYQFGDAFLTNIIFLQGNLVYVNW